MRNLCLVRRSFLQSCEFSEQLALNTYSLLCYCGPMSLLGALLIGFAFLQGIVQASEDIRAYDSCGSGMKMALTFDDGPAVSHGQTEKILDVLNKIDVKATFFVAPHVHDNDRMNDKCDLVSRMVSEGHYVGCHSWNDSDIYDWCNEDIKKYAVDPCVDWVRALVAVVVVVEYEKKRELCLLRCV